ncbi:MAG: pseudouridine synthase [Phycisphaerales bacterium]
MPHSNKPNPDSPRNESESKVRLQRFLADAGVAARRVCETMIEEGRVKVNKEVVRRLPVFIDPQNDRIEVDGKHIRPPAAPVYIMLNKPERVLSSTSDEPGLERTKATDLVMHALAPRLFPVGRLDWDSQGLLLLTNDGDFANRVSHPKFAVPKVYRVQVAGEVTPAAISSIRRNAKLLAKREVAMERLAAKEKAKASGHRNREWGMQPQQKQRRFGGAGGAGGGKFIPPHVRIIGASAPESGNFEARRSQGVTIEVTLLEANQAPLRDVLLAAGLKTRRLTRVGIGPLRLGNLKVGDWRELTKQEVRELAQSEPWFPPKDAPPQAAPTSATGTKPNKEPADKPKPPKPKPNPASTRSSEDRSESQTPKKPREPLGRRQPRTLLPE